MTSFHNQEIICLEIKKIEPQLTEMASTITKQYGNCLIKDIVQDVYIKCMPIFLGTEMYIGDFLNQVKDLCREVCFEYFHAEKKNAARPIKELPKNWTQNSGGWSSMSDAMLWERLDTSDNSTNALNAMIAIEEISTIKQYKGLYLTFENAKEYLSQLNIKSKDEYCKLFSEGKIPKNIPISPNDVYKEYFSTWEDYLNIRFLPYQEAKGWVWNNIAVKDKKEWLKDSANLPSFIPSEPNLFYKEYWEGWNTFLNIKKISSKYISFNEAKKWAEENLWEYQLNEKKWDLYIKGSIKNAPKLPLNIPKNPHIIYESSGWKGYFDFCGGSKYWSRKFPTSYYQCVKWIRNNAFIIKNQKEWELFVQGHYGFKKPEWMPPNPQIVYKNRGWVGWNLFLNPNGLQTDLRKEVFNCSSVRTTYNGKKVWVKPISIYLSIVTGTVIEMFSKVAKLNQVITFNINDIVEYGDSRILNNKIKNTLL